MPIPGKDRVVLLVRDPYWLQACWDVTRQSVARARAALAEHWHTCEPTLRLMQVDAGATTSTAESLARDIPIHGGVKNWYIDIQDSPNSYRVDLGYLAENGRFYTLARSNVVTTPRPGSSDAIDENWTDIAENYEKIYALSGGYEETSAGGDLQELFEERLRRPMGTPLVARCGGGVEQVLRRDKDFDFTVDAEMIIYGKTKAGLARHAGRRAGQAAFRRHVYGAHEHAGSPPAAAGGGQQPRRGRAADHRAGRRAEHQGHGTDDPRVAEFMRFRRPAAAVRLPGNPPFVALASRVGHCYDAQVVPSGITGKFLCHARADGVDFLGSR